MPSRSGLTARSWLPPAPMGMVRLINPENGSLVKEFAPVTVKTTRLWLTMRPSPPSPPSRRKPVETETLPRERRVWRRWR